jgi:hypothetical protein
MTARYFFTPLFALPLLAAPLLAQRTAAPHFPEQTRPVTPVTSLTQPNRPGQATFDPWFGGSKGISKAIDPSRGGLFKLGPGDSVGYSYYDLATNAAMPDRVINWPDDAKPQGAVTSTVVWTASVDAPTPPGRNYAASTRGSYGAQHDGTAWQPMRGEWARLDDERTGFVEIDRLSDGRIVMANHSGSGIVVWIELEAGTSQFFKQEIAGAEGGLWVSLAISENDEIHVIWTYQSGDDAGEIDYSRSLDGGNTFSLPMRLSGTNSVVGSIRSGYPGANHYAIAARGDNVAVWYLTGSIEILQLRSSDKGETWPIETAALVIDPQNTRQYLETDDPDQRLWPDPEFGADTAVGYRTDTVPGPGSSLDLLLDADGYTHGVAAIYPTYVRRYHSPGGDTSESTFRGGIIYKATYNYSDVGLLYVRERDNQMVQVPIAQPGGLDNSGDPENYPNYYIQRSYHGGYSLYPQLGMDASNNVYLTFSSGIATDLQQQQRRPDSAMKNWLPQHVFVTWMRADDPQRRWMAPQNLTPDGYDAKYAALANLVDDQLHIAYQIDPIVGEMITDTLAPIPREKNNIEVLFLNRSALADPMSVSTETGSQVALSAMPNPASGDVAISYSLARAGRTSLVLVDALGRTIRTYADEIATVPGTRTRTVSVADLANGIYYLMLTNDGVVSTTPVHVAH